MTENNANTGSTWVDPDDAPELDEGHFLRADVYEGDVLIRPGRPKGSRRKVSATVRYDIDVLNAFRATGKGWQTRMNDALREYVRTHPPSHNHNTKPLTGMGNMGLPFLLGTTHTP